VFTLQPTGRYYNSTYGYLDQLTYNSSGSAEDVTNLSLFGTSDLRRADLCRDAVQWNFTASVRPAAPVVVSGISVTAHAEPGLDRRPIGEPRAAVEHLHQCPGSEDDVRGV
jgi:hypothetical protein